MADGFFATKVSATGDDNAIANPMFVELTDGTTGVSVDSGTGALKVFVANSVTISGTVPVSGTVTADQGAPNSAANGWFVKITDGTNTLGTSGNPVRVDPTGTTTQPISAASLPLPTGASTSALQTTGNSSLSSIDGKLNSLGQKTMANSMPVVIASDQTPVPVSSAIAAQTGAVNDYSTASSVAGGASSNHDYTVVTSMKLTEVSFASSGGGKVELKVGPVGSLVSKWVGFIPKAGGEVHITFSPPILIPTTSTGTVRLVRTNRESQAQDLYSTIIGVDA